MAIVSKDFMKVRIISKNDIKTPKMLILEKARDVVNRVEPDFCCFISPVFESIKKN
ncbi:hypothetical protein [Treponema putidum]|uniref:hypothetical protein n=1 Tax=Treponema putidum TaxID=221027 RepID=UPI002102C4A9|nr:hypothetical protein [Treponema putidum]